MKEKIVPRVYGIILHFDSVSSSSASEATSGADRKRGDGESEGGRRRKSVI